MIAEPFGLTPSVDSPFAVMRSCHRRIEQRMGLLPGIADRLADDNPVIRAEALAVLESVHGFLSTTGIHHTADEEEDLYPILRETADPECLQVLDDLEQEHMRLEPILVAFDRLAGRMVETERLDEEAIAGLRHLSETLCELYQAHIRHEEGTLFPRAEVLLTPERLARLSQGMRDRRSGRPGSGPLSASP